jgi:hypothetical protein
MASVTRSSPSHSTSYVTEGTYKAKHDQRFVFCEEPVDQGGYRHLFMMPVLDVIENDIETYKQIWNENQVAVFRHTDTGKAIGFHESWSNRKAVQVKGGQEAPMKVFVKMNERLFSLPQSYAITVLSETSYSEMRQRFLNAKPAVPVAQPGMNPAAEGQEDPQTRKRAGAVAQPKCCTIL